MSIDFAALRPMAEQFMTDRCTIASPSTIAYDADLGYETETAGSTVYDGKCQIRPVRQMGADKVLQVGEGVLSFDAVIVRLPFDTVGISVNDVVTVTASNLYLAGRTLRVRGVVGGTDEATANLFCENVQTVDET